MQEAWVADGGAIREETAEEEGLERSGFGARGGAVEGQGKR